jgi:hypothetical protein
VFLIICSFDGDVIIFHSYLSVILIDHQLLHWWHRCNLLLYDLLPVKLLLQGLSQLPCELVSLLLLGQSLLLQLLLLSHLENHLGVCLNMLHFLVYTCL